VLGDCGGQFRCRRLVVEQARLELRDQDQELSVGGAAGTAPA